MNLINFDEKLYQTLRTFQKGEIDATSVTVGKLTPELTVVYDILKDAALELKHRFPDSQSEAYALCGKCGQCALCRAVQDHLRDLKAWARPIDMLLFCPKCSLQHVDGAEPEICECGCDQYCHQENGECWGKAVTEQPLPRTVHCDCKGFKVAWNNPPHKSHLCHGCGTVWRPAIVPTNGVATIDSRGEKDTWPEVSNA